MNLPNLDPTPQALDIPEQCLRCPTLSAINADYFRAQEFQGVARHIGEISLDGMPEEYRKAFTEHLNEEHSDELAAHNESADSVICAMEAETRVHASEMLEAADETVDMITEAATEIIAECQGGPIKMRATRDGAEFTVRICTSLASNPYNTAVDITRTRGHN